MAGSEVARLLQQIRDEEEAARRGLSGYALVSRHEFITTQMEKVGRCMQELTAVTGSDQLQQGSVVIKAVR